MARAIDADAVKRRAWDIAEAWKDQGRDYEALLLESVVEQIVDTQPTLTPPNEPLTLEELLRMDGTPVWLDVAGGMWALVDALDGCLWLDRGGSIDIAKFAGKAYCRPPEGDEDA